MEMGIPVDRHYTVIIIGGGVAGLSAANRLVDLGVKPLLIEGGSYPQQRICGEFLSYECLPLLENWNITIPFQIDQCSYIKGSSSYTFSLPKPCGSLSRTILEEQLLLRAEAKGATVLQNHSVKSWNQGIVTLETGEQIGAEKIILGTGKFGGQRPPLKYYGYKTHLSSPQDFTGKLEMHCINEGYLGINQIGKGIINVAILSEKPLDPSQLIQGTPLFPWLEGKIPEFGIRQHPATPHLFRVGDAIGTIPPASGDGLAMAITSGWMVANYAIAGDSAAYENAWYSTYRRRIRWGTLLHRYLLKSYGARPMMALCKAVPWISKKVFQLTRE